MELLWLELAPFAVYFLWGGVVVGGGGGGAVKVFGKTRRRRDTHTLQ